MSELNPILNDDDFERVSVRSECAANGDAGDENVERLLSVYAPIDMEADFETAMVDRMQQAALARRTISRFTFTHAAVTAVFALLVGLIAYMVFDSLLHPTRDKAPSAIQPITHGSAEVKSDSNTNASFTHLTIQPRVASPAVPQIEPGSSLQTEAGERRRVTLRDGSVLFLNENTLVKVKANRRLTLSRGEVYIEVASRRDADHALFVVETPSREVTALGTRFLVEVTDGLTGVHVTQGKVQVEGVDQPVKSGQKLGADSKKPQPAPQASHALDWASELLAAADSPLVPASDYSGGALVVADAVGNEGRLSLTQMHVDVHIEDGFARTTVDQVFFNHEQRRLEGTFYFPIPTDASISRLAMYVGRELNEAGMIERKRGREVFEDIVYKRRDPALLEWMDGSTFRMRVFPIEPREHKRIIISYTQKLNTAYDRTSYRFPAGHSLGEVGIWSFHARVKDGAKLKHRSPSHTLSTQVAGSDLHLRAEATEARTDKDVVLYLQDHGEDNGRAGRATRVGATAKLASFEQGDHRYAMVRFRPQLKVNRKTPSRHWVFLFESSADRNPLLARAQVDIVRHMLKAAEHDDTFELLTAATRVRRFNEKAMAVNAANTESAISWLERTHLVGALNLENALDEVSSSIQALQDDTKRKSVVVHLGMGISVLGDRDANTLLKQLPDSAHYIGIGVGKRWARSLMSQAAAQSGGYVTQINPDEPIQWRTVQLMAALNAPRVQDVRVSNGDKNQLWLTASRIAIDGDEICAVIRIPGDQTLPKRVTLEGISKGKPWKQVVRVQSGSTSAGYLPRYWTKLEIDRLIAADGERHRDQIVELSMANYVMSPYTSLLVLENDAMYKEYGVDNGREDHWAKYPAPKLMPLRGQIVRGYEDVGTLMADGAFDEAIKTLWIRYRQNTSDTNAMVLLARCYAAQGKTDAATNMLQQILKVDREQPDALAMLKQINMADEAEVDPIELARKLVTQERIEMGRQAEISGNYRVAIEHYLYVLNKIDGDNAEAKALLAAAQAKSDRSVNPRSPISVASNELQLQTQRAEAEYNELVNKAKSHAASKNYDLGQQALQEAKVILDRNRNALGSRRYEELRSAANTQYADMTYSRLEVEAVNMQQQAADDVELSSRRRLQAEIGKYESVQRLLRRAHELRKTQQYDRALQLTNQALFLDPKNPAAEAMKEMMEDSKIAVRSREFIRERSLRIANATVENHEATIPYNELITYPADWPQLTAVRLGYSRAGFDGESQLNRRVAQQLRENLPINFESNKLVNVIDYYRNTTGVNFFVNWGALEEAGVKQDLPITLQINRVSADRSLRMVFDYVASTTDKGAIDYAIIDGIVHISTLDDLTGPTGTRVYDIANLIEAKKADESNESSSRENNIKQLFAAIREAVGRKGEWAVNGGTISSLRELNGNLIVKTTHRGHEKLGNLLIALRAVRGLEMPNSSQRIKATEGIVALISDPDGISEQQVDQVVKRAGAEITELETVLAAVQFFANKGKVEKADALLRPLLADEKNRSLIDVDHWRLGAGIANLRGDLNRTIRYLETVVAIGYGTANKTIDFEAARKDHISLLDAYGSLAAAHELTKVEMPAVLAAKVIRVADQLRLIDADPTVICHEAAGIFQRLGRDDLAWDYLTTPLAHRPDEAVAWLKFGEELERIRKLEQAAAAYQSGFELEQTNPMYLLHRMRVLDRMGRFADAKVVAEKIRDGKWHRRFSDVLNEAYSYLRRIDHIE